MKQASEVPDELVDKAVQADYEGMVNPDLLRELPKWTDHHEHEDQRAALRSGMRAALAAVWDDIYAYGYTDGFSDKTELEEA